MSVKVSCFAAYPSEPPSLVETLEEAIRNMSRGHVVEIDGWKSTSTGGKFIITAICKAINDRALFICDATTLNHNVLFELGYAIARRKRVWILRNPHIEKSRADYERFKLLTTVGYIPYSNSREIAEAFYRERPYEDLESTIYRDTIESVISVRERSGLLYLRSGIETDASIKLSIKVHGSKIPYVIDDPSEVRIQTLSWYAQKVHNTYAVIAHFLSHEHTGSRLHNAKNSFVSGLAQGFGKPLLMLAHEPYESPIDYRDLLKTHETARQCEGLADAWLNDIERAYLQKTADTRGYEEELQAQAELQNITIGDSIAEHESKTLLEYFVSTAAYTEALRSKYSIVIGRRGSGKTAILYKIADDIGSDPRNHVCIIKPIAYQLEGVLRMLQQVLPRSEKGYLIESFWKFLIDTELARTTVEALESKPAYYQLDDAERQLADFVEENESIIKPDFSIRLESVVSSLQNIGATGSAMEQRVRISEFLHDRVIARVRSLLGTVLEKKDRVVILIDNLDKAWNQRADLRILCDLLFGLLGVGRRISLDFEKSDRWRRPVNLSLVIFLRSDIFTQIIKYARERDKISYSRIVWDDCETLLRVLEERFLRSSSVLAKPDEVWSRYFCPSVRDVPTREFLAKCIIPRPRDLIYLTKVAIAQAVNRGHTRVEEVDVLDAQKKYSQYALDSIVVENSIQMETLEKLLWEFIGHRSVVTREDILQAMKVCNIPTRKLHDVVELLCGLTFLGREVEDGRFEYQYNEEDKPKLQAMERKMARAREDGAERFRINEVFHPYLEIIPMPNEQHGL